MRTALDRGSGSTPGKCSREKERAVKPLQFQFFRFRSSMVALGTILALWILWPLPGIFAEPAQREHALRERPGEKSNEKWAPRPMPHEPTLETPPVGGYELRIVSPAVLELTLITTKAPDPAPVQLWNFVTTNGLLQLPAANAFAVKAGGHAVPVKGVGFRRRVIYAPLKERDLRIGNYLYLELVRAIGENQTVEVKNPDGTLWPAELNFGAVSSPLRWSPAIHVNQTGYLPGFAKRAMVGYYLGSLGELILTNPTNGLLKLSEPALQTAPAAAKPLNSPHFNLLDARTSKPVYQGQLTPRPDKGFTFACYQQVLEADFSDFNVPGEYRLQVPGLGVSYRFSIDQEVGGAFARTYALGLYHQRCGVANALPFTRFTHNPCHLASAEVPLPETNFPITWRVLAQKNADYARNPRHTGPQLTNNATSLYPFVTKGKIDVSGGHHDAGDYSKYTINSAGLIHFLIFASDIFPGVGELDNLGLPESGDQKSDLLQEAKWEADFLAKMQDADGGFYFLVYPRQREYEINVPCDRGDPQVVWPKNTAATAAAVAALAQCASSPRFGKQFPEAAKGYLERAKKGWSFLEKAIAKYGKDGAYQKITYYGDQFMHNDELVWSACEMFLATCDQKYQRLLLAWFNPADPGTRKWSWLRLYEAYGCAIRSYAFAAKSGRVKAGQLDVGFLSKCEGEIIAAAEDQLRRAQDSAYGTSFPEETKRVRAAGWYFSNDAGFDLAVASQLDYPPLNDPRPKFLEALLTNLNYEGGCNPVNISYVTGLGWKRPDIIVHQNALNFRQVLPPSGIPIGNIQAGFGWLDLYQRELGALTFPSDGDQQAPYPFYDRWGDSWNVSTEFVVLNQARALAVSALLMAKTPLKDQPWKSAAAQITGLDQRGSGQERANTSLKAPGLDLSRARVVWETDGKQSRFGPNATFTGATPGTHWVEAEALLPDGRRAFAVTNFAVPPPH